MKIYLFVGVVVVVVVVVVAGLVANVSCYCFGLSLILEKPE